MGFFWGSFYFHSILAGWFDKGSLPYICKITKLVGYARGKETSIFKISKLVGLVRGSFQL